MEANNHHRQKYFQRFGEATHALRVWTGKGFRLSFLTAKCRNIFEREVANSCQMRQGILTPCDTRKCHVVQGRLVLKATDDKYQTLLAQIPTQMVSDKPALAADGTINPQTVQSSTASVKCTSVPAKHKDMHELFLPEKVISIIDGKPNSSSSMTDIVAIKCASVSMPLGRFLEWIVQSYNIDSLLPEAHPYTATVTRKPVPPHIRNLYRRLVTLETQYDPKHFVIKNEHTLEILGTVHSQLKWLQKTIEFRLKEIEEYHDALAIRDFATWAYDNFSSADSDKLFSKYIRWNPHSIWSESRIVKEVVAYFEQKEFVEHDGELSIYAKEIACLLRGGRDWKELRGERLVSQHPTPAQVSALRAMLSKGLLRG